MAKVSLIILATLLLLPLALATDCTKVSQSECGTNNTSSNATACQFYVWTNNSCQPPASCQTSPTVTVWSNFTNNCIPCLQADQSFCPNCAIHSFYFNTNLGICTTCTRQFSVQCLTCNQSQCLTCNTGYELSSDLQGCRSSSCTIPYCEDCSDSTTCQTCDSSHTVQSGSCVCKIANCKYCGSGICFTCYDGYSVDTFKTSCKLNCMANCDSCTSLSSCTTCASGYNYDSSVKRCRFDCTVIDSNCVACRSATICTSCATGFRPSASGALCESVCDDSKCESCSTTTNCTRCMTGYTLKANNASLFSCSLDICQIPFCMACSTTSSCSSCATYFQLSSDNSTCEPSCGVTNCAFCLTNTTCLTCINGYIISSGSCVSVCSIANCQLCASGTTCQRCSDGFLLSANGQSCGFDCRIAGCEFCNSATTCLRCGSGRSLNSNSTRCIVDCQDGFYLSTTTSNCVSCPTSNCRTCNSLGRCTTCLDFYYLNVQTFACVACSSISNCYNCQQASAICTECMTDFFLVDNACVAIGACNVTNCMACTPDNSAVCLICNDNYNLANGGAACNAIACPGNQIAVASTCVCGEKSYLSGGTCIACSDANCLDCTSTACISCANGYYPSATSCVVCADPNCNQCNSRGCTKCKRGFFIRGGECQQKLSSRGASVSRTGVVISCPLGCASCDVDNFGNRVCLQANDGYIQLNGKIYQCALPCLTCSVFLDVNGAASKCQSCPIGYALSRGTCLTCSDPYAITCMSTNRDRSLTCLPGYTTLNGTTMAYAGTCLPCADNCIKCALTGSGNCDRGGCAPSTTQKSDGCLLCFNGCFKCSGNPNICIQCSQYYYLSATQSCLPCSTNCLSCNSTVCFNCQAGTFLVNNQCKTPPSVPNCVAFDSTYTNCTACDFNYNLNNATNLCELILTCNSTSDCKNCPYGFYLNPLPAGACITCPTIANCSSCDMLNSSRCGECATGFYLDAGSCKVCSMTGCSACSSPIFCTTATPGYYLARDIANAYTGQVHACAGNCLTCTLSEINCVTCKPGSTLSGTECVSNNNQAVTIVLYLKSLGRESSVSAEAETGQVYNFIFGYYGRIGRSLGFRSTRECQRHFRLRRIFKGSVSIDSTIDSDSTNVDVSSAIANTQDSNFGLVSTSVVNNSQSTESNVNLGLILGVSIPLGLIFIIIIVLIKFSGTRDEDGRKAVEETEKEVRNKDIEAL